MHYKRGGGLFLSGGREVLVVFSREVGMPAGFILVSLAHLQNSEEINALPQTHTKIVS